MVTLQYLRVYTSPDYIGVEIGGALKNIFASTFCRLILCFFAGLFKTLKNQIILAVAAGICEGIGMKYNTIALLVTRGINEMKTIGEKLGADPSTLSGLSGVGDLMLT